jgi:hypothetical protein
MKWQAKAILVLLSLVAVIADAQSSTENRSSAQETQARRFWLDSSTGLMWAGKDNGKDVTWHGARRYCRKLRLGSYSDWRLALIAELVGIYDKTMESPGENPRSRWNEAEPMTFHVKGNLFLTGKEWGGSPLVDIRRNPPGGFMYFDFRTGNGIMGFEDLAEGDFEHALCVRGSEE